MLLCEDGLGFKSHQTVFSVKKSGAMFVLFIILVSSLAGQCDGSVSQSTEWPQSDTYVLTDSSQDYTSSDIMSSDYMFDMSSDVSTSAYLFDMSAESASFQETPSIENFDNAESSIADSWSDNLSVSSYIISSDAFSSFQPSSSTDWMISSDIYSSEELSSPESLSTQAMLEMSSKTVSSVVILSSDIMTYSESTTKALSSAEWEICWYFYSSEILSSLEPTSTQGMLEMSSATLSSEVSLSIDNLDYMSKAALSSRYWSVCSDFYPSEELSSLELSSTQEMSEMSLETVSSEVSASIDNLNFMESSIAASSSVDLSFSSEFYSSEELSSPESLSTQAKLEMSSKMVSSEVIPSSDIMTYSESTTKALSSAEWEICWYFYSSEILSSLEPTSTQGMLEMSSGTLSSEVSLSIDNLDYMSKAALSSRYWSVCSDFYPSEELSSLELSSTQEMSEMSSETVSSEISASIDNLNYMKSSIAASSSVDWSISSDFYSSEELSSHEQSSTQDLLEMSSETVSSEISASIDNLNYMESSIAASSSVDWSISSDFYSSEDMSSHEPSSTQDLLEMSYEAVSSEISASIDNLNYMESSIAASSSADWSNSSDFYSSEELSSHEQSSTQDLLEMSSETVSSEVSASIDNLDYVDSNIAASSSVDWSISSDFYSSEELSSHEQSSTQDLLEMSSETVSSEISVSIDNLNYMESSIAASSSADWSISSEFYSSEDMSSHEPSSTQDLSEMSYETVSSEISASIDNLNYMESSIAASSSADWSISSEFYSSEELSSHEPSSTQDLSEMSYEAVSSEISASIDNLNYMESSIAASSSADWSNSSDFYSSEELSSHEQSSTQDPLEVSSETVSSEVSASIDNLNYTESSIAASSSVDWSISSDFYSSEELSSHEQSSTQDLLETSSETVSSEVSASIDNLNYMESSIAASSSVDWSISSEFYSSEELSSHEPSSIQNLLEMSSETVSSEVSASIDNLNYMESSIAASSSADWSNSSDFYSSEELSSHEQSSTQDLLEMSSETVSSEVSASIDNLNYTESSIAASSSVDWSISSDFYSSEELSSHELSSTQDLLGMSSENVSLSAYSVSGFAVTSSEYLSISTDFNSSEVLPNLQSSLTQDLLEMSSETMSSDIFASSDNLEYTDSSIVVSMSEELSMQYLSEMSSVTASTLISPSIDNLVYTESILTVSSSQNNSEVTSSEFYNVMSSQTSYINITTISSMNNLAYTASGTTPLSSENGSTISDVVSSDTLVDIQPSSTHVSLGMSSDLASSGEWLSSTTEPTNTSTTEPTTMTTTTEPTNTSTTEPTTLTTTTEPTNTSTTEPTTMTTTTEPTNTSTTEPTTLTTTTEPTNTSTTEPTTMTTTTEPTNTSTTEPTTMTTTTEPTNTSTTEPTTMTTTTEPTNTSTTEPTTLTTTTEPTNTSTTEPTTMTTTTEPTNTSTTEPTTMTTTTEPTNTSTTEPTTMTTTTEPTTTTTTTEPTTTTTTTEPTTTTTTTEPTTTTTTSEPTTTTTTTEPTTTTTTTTTTQMTTTTSQVVSADFDGEGCPDGRLLPYKTTSCHRADDWSYGPIKLRKLELPACDKVYTTIFVNPNGYIALGKDFRSYRPKHLDTVNADIVAFYWYDFMMYDCNMFINVYESNENGMLDKISTLVRRRHSNKFQAHWAVVVTWIDAYGWPGVFKSQKMTFQGILATDGDKTYYMAIFKDSTLTDSPWRNMPVLGWRCSINNPKPLTRPRWYQNIRAYRIHLLAQPLNANKVPTAKCKGLYIWTKISNKEKRTGASKKCLDWHSNEKKQLSLINSRASNWRFVCHCWWFFEWLSGSRYNWHPYNRNTMCFFKRSAWWLNFASMECCYRNGLLIQNGPDMGSYVTARSTYYKGYWYRKYNDENIKYKKWCCQKSKNCDSYFEVRPRPIRWCSWWPLFFIGWFWGDPHITTLDNLGYTFNGLGEYIMLKGEAGNSSAELQARTCHALDKDGKPVNATIFCAFAGKDNTGAKFRVELNVETTRDKMLLYVNEDDWTYQFYNDERFEPDINGIEVTKTNDSALQIVFESGVKYVFSVKAKTLSLETSVPSDFNGTLVGLLGNYDGDKTNDYIPRNGPMLEFKNYTERELYFSFGQTWAITESESLFNYTSEKPFSHFNDKSFVPFFADEASEADRNAAKAACQPDPTNACIVDYLLTKDDALAKASGDVQSSSGNITSNLENQTPQISGPTTVTFTIGQPTDLVFNATDDGSYSYQVKDQPSTGTFSFNISSGVAIWTPQSTTTESITVTVKDDKGVEAAPVEVKILICSGCSGHGSCDSSTVRSGDTTLMHNVLACICSSGWSGDDCDEDQDACLQDPCADGQNCTDLTPEAEITFGRGYNCSDCATGYQVENNKCEDIDECNGTNTCDQKCVNNGGSYTCTCFSGYRRTNDACLDIDECNEGTNGCDQVCTNNAGSYSCGCHFGFDLQSDKRSCNKVEDICPLYNLTCSYGCANNTDEVMVCTCKNGYEIDTDGTSCKDTNECKGNICSQKCTNTDGSFTCSCYDGYTLNGDKSSCDACQNSYWGPLCANECDCGDGSDRCDSAVGCVCSQYYTGDNCTDDVDECTENPTICGTDKTCTNDEGSYDCNCLDGYVEDGSGNCIDINECDESESNEDLDEYQHNCTLTQSTCQNINGGFTCDCLSGYNQNGPYSCEDIDECAVSNHNCDQICKNMAGSYYCECYLGFQLNDTDRRTCHKMSNPCQSFNINCSYACIIENSAPLCQCESGYLLAADGVTCFDIDECSIDSKNDCGQKENCQNTQGGYTCSCTTGYRLENDGRSCTACDSFHYGINCASVCGCHQLGAERCDSITGCICNNGWAGKNCSTDVDECILTPTRCPETNERCVNTIGSYECRCKSGYSNATGTCLNIDECTEKKATCAQGCVDTGGSYTCTCENGFKLADDGSQCTDIDECSSTLAKCGQVCSNSVGSYRCSCYDGFLLNTTDRRQCHVKTECDPSHTCTQNCALNSTKHEVCSCNSGYQLNADGKTCDNIDECTTLSPCTETCSDQTPGFLCFCSSGKKIDVDQVTCINCTEGTYGGNCTNNCTCITDNTLSCDKVSGSCTCKSGYTGTNCETNIDECSTGTAQCGDNSKCRDTNGSYACDCNAGFTAASVTTCIECSDQRYGINCGSICSCVAANTETCNKTNGYCTCKSGWNGTNCETDINECTENPGICTHGKKCFNKDGTHECKCATGYAENSTNWCTDVDECFKTTDNCSSNANCTNTEGSFTCVCKFGYNGDGYTCSAPTNPGVVDPNFDSGGRSTLHNVWFMQLLMALIAFTIKRWIIVSN